MSDSGSRSHQPIIEAVRLVKNYGRQAAVNDISFSVDRGEVVGFLGPNGAGKSTTMKMLTGFLKPTSGQARIAGLPMDEASLAARELIGYLPENAPLYEEMMVIDFLRFVADVRGVGASHRAARLRHVVERCGLGNVLGKDISQLSRGYRQRVGLAQALVHDPALLILDEPTSGLDPNQIVEIRALIRDLGREKTVLLSTHILSEVQAVCSRAIIINHGSLVADDTPDALVRGGDAAAVALVVRGRHGESIEREAVTACLAALDGVLSVTPGHMAADAPLGAVAVMVRASGERDLRERLFDTAVAQNWCVLEMRQEAQSLEQTFQRLTGASQAQSTGSDRHAA